MKTAREVLKQKTSRMVTVSPDTTIFDAVGRMVENKIGAILVKDEEEIVGIWTERDYLRNTLLRGFDPKTARIGEFMVTSLKHVPADTPIEVVQEMFLGLFIRHVLVKDEGRYVGMLSIGDVIRSMLLEKDKEIRELNRIASWEYYENWGWHHKYTQPGEGGNESE